MQCACTSEKFRFKFSKAGGLKYLQFQLHEASNDEFNKVSINNSMSARENCQFAIKPCEN